MTALYARVSTDRADGSGRKQSTENQVLLLQDWCSKQLITEYRLYEDKMSGKDVNRVQFQRMLKDVASGEIDCVVVTALDRLTRSLYDFTRLARGFKKQNVRFVATTQGIDIFNPEIEYNPINVFFANLLAAFAELEREMISQRIKSGMDRAKKHGRKLGRERKQGAIPAVIERMLDQGMTKEQIAKELDMSVTTLYRRMRKLGIGPWGDQKDIGKLGDVDN